MGLCSRKEFERKQFDRNRTWYSKYMSGLAQSGQPENSGTASDVSMHTRILTGNREGIGKGSLQVKTPPHISF